MPCYVIFPYLTLYCLNLHGKRLGTITDRSSLHYDVSLYMLFQQPLATDRRSFGGLFDLSFYSDMGGGGTGVRVRIWVMESGLRISIRVRVVTVS